MRDLDAPRRSGRAGGEHHIDGVARAGGGRRRRVGFAGKVLSVVEADGPLRRPGEQLPMTGVREHQPDVKRG